MNPTQDLSFLSLILNASLLVQLVMLLLLGMSIASWTIIFRKGATLRAVQRDTERFERDFWSGGDLNTLLEAAQRNPRSAAVLERIFAGGMQEFLKAREIDAARAIAARLGAVRHVVLPLDLRQFGGSALTSDIAVPKQGLGPDIPVTYVPARNLVFLSLTLAWAEALGGSDIFIGVNALDYSGYPDCRPEFIAGFEKLARLATKAGATGELIETVRGVGYRFREAKEDGPA